MAIIFIFSINSFSDTVQYQYDALNRLTRMERSGGTVMEFEYDKMGNRIAVRIITGSHSYDIDQDGDVDGLDLIDFATKWNGDPANLAGFANHFGTEP
jgi:YD repeat-containing protein